MINQTRLVCLLLSAVMFLTSCTDPKPENAVSRAAIQAIDIISFPERIDTSCRDGKAKIYDECGDQRALLEMAMQKAKAENKTVLVSYGAEWCIWCHVFAAYIKGDIEKFTHHYGEPNDNERYKHTMYERLDRDVSQEAYDLKKFVSDNFVVAHIEFKYSDGDDVLAKTGAAEYYYGWVPFIFTLDEDGQYAEQFYHDEAEVRRDTFDWYRGYDRVNLLTQLKKMHEMATLGPPTPR